ncbi:Pentatricopeptide repeat-containing protein [Durusdinium trenchii]|uniref:Mitochondrial n=1 Tax=Durusdinium trenchii TaxID=1381693 RepID=A0ABP0I0F5_9DINO
MATSSLVDSLPNGWTHAELAELEETLATETGADPGALTSDSRPWQSEDQRATDPAREAGESENPTHDPSVDTSVDYVWPRGLGSELSAASSRRRRRRNRSTAQEVPSNPSPSGVPLPAMLPIEARGKGVGKSSDDSELLKVMKQLLEERKNDKSSQSSWDTRKGPSPGIKWKGGTPPNPPKWNYSSSDLRAFSKFEREAEAESEHMELSRVNDKNGVDYILSCLKGPLEQKVLYQKRALLANYEVVARTANETIRQYINRYKRIERDLQAVGIQTGKGGYPPRKVFQAEHETAHEAENEDELAMADMAAEDEEFFEPEENPDASPPVDPDPDQEDDDDLGASLSELASVLTALAKEEKARARLQLGGPNPRLPLVVTYGDEQPQDPQDPFYTFPANLMVDVPDAPFVYVTETIDLAGYMVLDTACQRSCAGSRWMGTHMKLLGNHGLQCHQVPCDDRFQFGAGACQQAATRCYFPAAFISQETQGIVLGASVLDVNIPFLASRILMEQLCCVIDMHQGILHFAVVGISVPLKRKHGHLVACITAFPPRVSHMSCWSDLQDDRFWHEPSPELVVHTEALAVSDGVSITAFIYAGQSIDETATHMAGTLEDLSPPPVPVGVQCHQVHAQAGAPRNPSKDMAQQHGFARAAGEASCTDAEDHGVTEGLHSPRVPAIRQPPRPLRQVQETRSKVQVEPRARSLGGTLTNIFKLVCAALTLTGHNPLSVRTGSQDHGSQEQVQSSQEQEQASTTSALRHQINYQLRLHETHVPRPDDERLPGIGVHSRGVREHHGMLRGKGADLRQSGSVPLRSGELGLEGMMDSDHDYWEKGKNKLTRHHNMPRLLLYNLHHQDCPIPKHLLWSDCRAEVQYEDGTFETVQYDWRSRQETQLKMPWTGRTVFTIQNSNNQSTGLLSSAARRALRGKLRELHRVYKIEYDLVSQSKDDDHLLEHFKKSRDTRSKVDILETFAGQANTSRRSGQFGLSAAAPIDYATGWDLQKTAHLDQLKPLILIQGIDCRDWCILQDNTNYVRRKILLLMRRAKARRLLKKVCQWCRKQVDEGRMFLLENPTTSRIWFEPVMTSLLNLPGVTTITCHAGSYGAQDSEGNMIRKGHRFMGNCPHVLARLSRKLTPDQQKQCVPLQGKETTLSQHYPPEMVAEILRGVREEVHHRHPDRQRQPRTFFTTFMVTAVDQWAEALQMADSTFQVTRYKSFTLPTSDPLFLKALELSQWKHMERVQIPGGFPGTCLTHRAAVLRYTDGQVDVIEEDLQELRHPKARFKKPVDVGIFMFGQARQAEPHASHPPEAKRLRPDQDDTATTQASDRPDDNPRSIMPNPSEDITFPDTLKISAEIKNSLRRMHKNLAHPRPAELKRLLDGISDQRIHTAVESMSCDTCNRTKGPSRPAPSGVMADDGASQFADRVQMDIFYVRDLTGANHMILGVICEVTHLHLGFLLQNRSPEEITRCFTLGWARAFGFPLRIRTDPDGSIRAAFEAAMDEAGVYMDYVPAEAHNKIGLIERHNATYRSLMERVIEQQAVVGSNQMELTTAAAAHAKNSCTWSAGRPPYVAAFGRIPRQGMELLSDPHGLVTGQTRAQAQQLADTLRVEAQQQIAAMSVDSTFRLLGRDPDGKSMWVQAGTNTVRVAPHQLRVARGFENWNPDYQQIKALRQASHNLDDNNIQDDTVPAPPEQLDDPDQPLENDDHELIPEVSEPALPLLVPQASRANQQAHHTEEAVQTDPYLQQQSGAPQVEYHLNVHSPTYKQTIIHHTPTSTAEYTIRHDTRAMDAAGSECPQASEAEVIDVDGLSDKTPPLQKDHLAHVVPSTPPDLALDTRQTSKRSSTEMEQPIPEQAPRASADFAALLTKHIRQQRIGNNTYILHGYQNIAKAANTTGTGLHVWVVWDTPYDSDQDGRTILPERTNLITELWHEPYAAHLSSLETTPDGIQFRDHYQDGSEHVKMPYACHYAFQAYRAVPGYTGTGESSDSEASADDMTAGHQGTTKTLTRQEQKALDKEVPWQAILEMNQEDIDKYVDSAKAEETSWQQFNSVIPLTTQEASQVFKDPILKKRILRSRAAYRDKAKGQGPLKAKTRVVALGHLDPDLKELCRESATPTRQSEYVLYAIFIAGHNNMFLDGHDNGSYGVVTSKPHSCRGRQILVVFRCTCFLLKMG